MIRARLSLLILLLAVMLQPAHTVEPSPLSKGYLVVTFDDGRDGALAYAAPILQQDGVYSTMFLYEESLDAGWQGFLNLPGALKLQNTFGWQFEGHSLTHPDMNHLASNQLASEVTMSKSVLQQDGFRPIASFAYPYNTGWDNATVLGLVRQGYVAARTADISGNVSVTYDRSRQLGPSGCTICPPDRYQLYGNVVSNVTSVQTVKSYIDQATSNHTVLILVFHQIVSQSPQQYEYLSTDLKSVMDYANQKIQNGTLESLYFSEAVQLLFGISSFPPSCWLFCSIEIALTSFAGVVIATVAGVAWAFVLVRWNKRKTSTALPTRFSIVVWHISGEYTQLHTRIRLGVLFKVALCWVA